VTTIIYPKLEIMTVGHLEDGEEKSRTGRQPKYYEKKHQAL